MGAGAVVNAGVAWAFAYRYSPPSSDPAYLVPVPENSRFWLQHRPAEWQDALLQFVTRKAGMGRTVTNAIAHLTPPRTIIVEVHPEVGLVGGHGGEVVIKNEGIIIEAAYGWPFRSLRWISWIGKGGEFSYRRSPVIERFDKRGRAVVFLPLLPLWGGFAINTAFYAGVLWLLILGPFALRRYIRRRRGLCPKCAYPVGESAVCSECGRKLTT